MIYLECSGAARGSLAWECWEEQTSSIAPEPELHGFLPTQSACRVHGLYVFEISSHNNLMKESLLPWSIQWNCTLRPPTLPTQDLKLTNFANMNSSKQNLCFVLLSKLSVRCLHTSPRFHFKWNLGGFLIPADREKHSLNLAACASFISFNVMKLNWEGWTSYFTKKNILFFCCQLNLLSNTLQTDAQQIDRSMVFPIK